MRALANCLSLEPSILSNGVSKLDMPVIAPHSALCKRQEDSEPRAVAKLSHLLAIQTIRTMSPVSVNSAESESSHLPSSEYDCDGPADLRGQPSFAHCQRLGSIGQTPDSR